MVAARSGTRVVAADASEEVEESWAAAGLAERFVASWLAGDPDSIEPPAGAPEAAAEASAVAGAGNGHDSAGVDGPVGRAVGVEQLGEGSWSVIVAAAAAGGVDAERFWQVGVVSDGDGGGLRATGSPTPVAAPPVPEQVERLQMGALGPVPTEDGELALVETVEGFVSSHACRAGPLERWLAPGVAIEPVDPPVCEQVELQGWAAGGDGEDVRTVVVEALLSTAPADDGRDVSYGLVVADRDGRWEIDDLLPALPVDGEEVGSS